MSVRDLGLTNEYIILFVLGCWLLLCVNWSYVGSNKMLELSVLRAGRRQDSDVFVPLTEPSWVEVWMLEEPNNFSKDFESKNLGC